MKRSYVLFVWTSALSSLLAPALLRADTAYRVGPEDVLKVQVARHEEMNAEVEVLPDGNVALPVIGTLRVTGLSVEQIRDQVVSGLRKKLVSPDVTIEVSRPRPQRVFVSGIGIKMPQPLDMKEGWRITEALANAGGLVVRPEVARGTLFRLPDQTLTLDLARIYVDQDPTANLRLQPGDVIDIEEAPTVRIFVSGQVQKPGMLDLTRGRGVVEALALAGGPLSTAALSKAYVVKKGGRKLFVNLAHLINHPSAGAEPVAASAPNAQPPLDTDLPLEPGDELVVPENVTKIVVWGLVNHPQVYPLQDGETTTLADAIALAGGLDKRARKSQIGILRLENGKETLLTVNMNRFMKGKEINPPLQDRDIVYVPETETPDWAGKILPSLEALAGSVFYLK